MLYLCQGLYHLTCIILQTFDIIYVSKDVKFPECLTPNHFLFGSSSSEFPNPAIIDEIPNSRQQWKTVKDVKEGELFPKSCSNGRIIKIYPGKANVV